MKKSSACIRVSLLDLLTLTSVGRGIRLVQPERDPLDQPTQIIRSSCDEIVILILDLYLVPCVIFQLGRGLAFAFALSLPARRRRRRRRRRLERWRRGSSRLKKDGPSMCMSRGCQLCFFGGEESGV